MKFSGRFYTAVAGGLVSLSGLGVVAAYVMAMLANAPSLYSVAQLTSTPVRTAADASGGPSWWQALTQQSEKFFARTEIALGDGVLMVTPSDREQLQSHFSALDYVMPVAGQAAKPRMEVPRLYLRSLPHDLAAGDSNWDRKRDFIQVMLPLVLAGNEKILAERQKAQRLEQHIRNGGNLYAVNRAWLTELAARYGIEDFDPITGDWQELLSRVDVVPPSLALAQAAKESGWGTSRFARQGNAVFGQWSWKPGSGIIPAGRAANQEHEVRRFAQLSESVSAYMHNLNTHAYYDKFRSRRAATKAKGESASGLELARYLERYSTEGQKYIADLREIIEINLLQHLDEARLRPSRSNGLTSS